LGFDFAVGPHAERSRVANRLSSGLGTWSIRSGTAHTISGVDLPVCSQPLTFDGTTVAKECGVGRAKLEEGCRPDFQVGRQHGGHCPSPGLSCAETFADCSRPLVSKPSRGLREKRSLLHQTAFFFRSTPTHPFWSQGLASTLLLRVTCIPRPEQMKLNSRNQC
jgi:hypothetical protein